MQRLTRKFKLIAAALCVVLAFLVPWAWQEAAGVRGRLQAHIDMRKGKYQLLGYGLPTASRPDYARCLRVRCDVELNAVTGCIVSPSLMTYVDSYDEVVVEAMSRKFGRNISMECSLEAERNWAAGRTEKQ